MRIKAFFTSNKQAKDIEYSLGWWNHYDTYGADISWDKEKDHFLVYGTAVCEAMGKELKKQASKVMLEDFREL